jgi:hypothetical protein
VVEIALQADVKLRERSGPLFAFSAIFKIPLRRDRSARIPQIADEEQDP